MRMGESEVSTLSSSEGHDEKRNAGPGRAPAVVVYTSKKLLWAAFIL